MVVAGSFLVVEAEGDQQRQVQIILRTVAALEAPPAVAEEVVATQVTAVTMGQARAADCQQILMGQVADRAPEVVAPVLVIRPTAAEAAVWVFPAM